MPPKLRTRTAADIPVFGEPQPAPEPEEEDVPPPIVPEFEEEGDDPGSQDDVEIIDEEIVSGPETIVVVEDDEDLMVDVAKIAEDRATDLVSLKPTKEVATPEPEQKVSRNPFMRSVSIGLPKLKI